MALEAPQLQWSLDNSAGSFLSFGRGFIEAASSDNVQVLALLTCESSGATLPVATLTRLKLEKLARRNDSQPLSFIKAKVGWRAGDAADVLSRSDGGIRFLCLAALLCCRGGHLIDPAQTLDRLIRRNASGNQRFPTIMQLHDLLNAIRPKLLHCGFTKSVVGWMYTLVPARNDRLVWFHEGRMRYTAPGTSEFETLVEALQRCCRLGETGYVVVISSHLQWIPWTITVVEWLTGLTPAVRPLEADSPFMVKSSLVTIHESAVPSYYQVSVCTLVDSIHQLITLEGHSANDTALQTLVVGTLDVQTWMRVCLDESDIGITLASKVLIHAISTLPKTVVFSREVRNIVSQRQRTLAGPLSHALPKKRVRHKVLSYILKEQFVELMPQLNHVLQEIRDQCSHDCGCEPEQDKFWSQHDGCFKRRMGTIIADVLALLLFRPQETREKFPRFTCPYGSRPDPDLSYGTDNKGAWKDVIVACWWLTGRWNNVGDLFGLLLTATDGQVIYPMALDSRRPHRSGYLCLVYRPGRLEWEGQNFAGIYAKHSFVHTLPWEVRVSRNTGSQHLDHGFMPTVKTGKCPYFLVGNSPMDLQYVQMAIVLPPTMVQPIDLFEGFSQTLFTPPCHHSLQTPAGASAEGFFLALDDHEASPVSFVPGDRNLVCCFARRPFNQLIQLALSTEICLFQGEACIKCTLDFAKEIGVNLVVC